MKKILVIGSGGAGKSTFAARLGEILGIEVVHLDSRYWRPGWVEPPKHEWAATVDDLLGGDAWIMDGNYSGTLERRLAACDAVVVLDMSPVTCVWRVTRRAMRYWGTTRPDMAEGCPEQLTLEFLLWVWNYRRRSLPKVVRRLGERGGDTKVIWLRSRAEGERFLARAKDAGLADGPPALG